MVGVLIEVGSCLTLKDSNAQTPIDMHFGLVQQVVSKENNAGRLFMTLLTSRW